MSAKPRFKPRVGYARASRREDKEPCAHIHLQGALGAPCYRVRITDARDLTPEKAVEKVLQNLLDCKIFGSISMHACAKPAGMTASVVNGKVRVRRAKE